MSIAARRGEESVEDFVMRCYCVYGTDGEVNEPALKQVTDAVLAVNPSFFKKGDATLPNVPGVARLRARIDKPDDVVPVFAKLLSAAEADPRLHALSFADPLALGIEMGVAVTPPVARFVRRVLASVVPFDRSKGPLEASGKGRFGIESLHWRPHRKKE
jgi:hypothetical protein